MIQDAGTHQDAFVMTEGSEGGSTTQSRRRETYEGEGPFTYTSYFCHSHLEKQIAAYCIALALS